MSRLLIVGGGLAGHRAALAARRLDPDTEIVMLAKEHERPYQRPPLSKGFLLGTVSRERVHLRTSEGAYDLRLGVKALEVDLEGRRVLTTAGEERFDRLLVATGAEPRRLSGFPPSDKVVYLRTLEDASRLRTLLSGGRHCTVIGGGFIGLEVAASARQLGLDVDLVEMAERLLVRAVGPMASAHLETTHRELGVRLHFGTSVEWIDEAQGLLAIAATEIRTDVVVVGIGVSPAVEWVRDALEVDRALGIRAAATGLATADGTVAVAGDAGTWWHPLFARHVRFEHFETAATQGVIAARNLLGGPSEELRDLPFGWSDQGPLLVQVLGAPSGDLEEESIPLEDGYVFLYHGHERIEGAVLMNAPEMLVPTKKRIEGAL